MKQSLNEKKVVIIGAGPAGLTAGVELLKNNKNVSIHVLERDDVVGGLARTVEYHGAKFDIGPHHFITESPKIEAWWKDLMGKDFLKHRRFTRIFYNKRYFNYPLDAFNVIKGLNPFECFRCVASYAWRRIFPIKKVRSFEDWVTNQFGYRLFSIFFKTYTEKVWGLSCKVLSSDWAAQRIKGFSLSKAIFYAFFGRWFKKNAPRTLSDEFYYPPHGAGQMWEKVAHNLSAQGGKVVLSQPVNCLMHDGSKITGVKTALGNQEMLYPSDYVFSSMPLKVLINALNPIAPVQVRNAANALCYRGLITINLIVNKKDMFPDHWLYIHDKDVKMGRIGNMSNFSEHMTADPNHTALSLEYFNYVNEGLWNESDETLLALGRRELEVLGICKSSDVLDGMVLRTAEAYPVYDEHYREHLGAVLTYLKGFSNLHLIGRNGMHRYNNQDLAMLSAMDAVDALEKQILENAMQTVNATQGSKQIGL
jgi:protoporphyrinogen oxidase